MLGPNIPVLFRKVVSAGQPKEPNSATLSQASHINHLASSSQSNRISQVHYLPNNLNPIPINEQKALPLQKNIKDSVMSLRVLASYLPTLLNKNSPPLLTQTQNKTNSNSLEAQNRRLQQQIFRIQLDLAQNQKNKTSSKFQSLSLRYLDLLREFSLCKDQCTMLATENKKIQQEKIMFQQLCLQTTPFKTASLPSQQQNPMAKLVGLLNSKDKQIAEYGSEASRLKTLLKQAKDLILRYTSSPQGRVSVQNSPLRSFNIFPPITSPQRDTRIKPAIRKSIYEGKISFNDPNSSKSRSPRERLVSFRSSVDNKTLLKVNNGLQMGRRLQRSRQSTDSERSLSSHSSRGLFLCDPQQFVQRPIKDSGINIYNPSNTVKFHQINGTLRNPSQQLVITKDRGVVPNLISPRNISQFPVQNLKRLSIPLLSQYQCASCSQSAGEVLRLNNQMAKISQTFQQAEQNFTQQFRSLQNQHEIQLTNTIQAKQFDLNRARISLDSHYKSDMSRQLSKLMQEKSYSHGITVNSLRREIEDLKNQLNRERDAKNQLQLSLRKRQQNQYRENGQFQTTINLLKQSPAEKMDEQVRQAKWEIRYLSERNAQLEQTVSDKLREIEFKSTIITNLHEKIHRLETEMRDSSNKPTDVVSMTLVVSKSNSESQPSHTESNNRPNCDVGVRQMQSNAPSSLLGVVQQSTSFQHMDPNYFMERQKWQKESQYKDGIIETLTKDLDQLKSELAKKRKAYDATILSIAKRERGEASGHSSSTQAGSVADFTKIAANEQYYTSSNRSHVHEVERIQILLQQKETQLNHLFIQKEKLMSKVIEYQKRENNGHFHRQYSSVPFKQTLNSFVQTDIGPEFDEYRINPGHQSVDRTHKNNNWSPDQSPNYRSIGRTQETSQASVQTILFQSSERERDLDTNSLCFSDNWQNRQYHVADGTVNPIVMRQSSDRAISMRYSDRSEQFIDINERQNTSMDHRSRKSQQALNGAPTIKVDDQQCELSYNSANLQQLELSKSDLNQSVHSKAFKDQEAIMNQLAIYEESLTHANASLVQLNGYCQFLRMRLQECGFLFTENGDIVRQDSIENGMAHSQGTTTDRQVTSQKEGINSIPQNGSNISHVSCISQNPAEPASQTSKQASQHQEGQQVPNIQFGGNSNEVQILKKHCFEMTTAIERLNSEVDQRNQVIMVAEDRFCKLEGLKSTLQQQNQYLRQYQEELTNQLALLRNNRHQMSEQENQYSQQNEQMRGQIILMAKEIETLQNQSKESSFTIQKLSHNLQEFQTVKNELSIALNNERANLDKQKAEKLKLEEQMKYLQNHCQQLKVSLNSQEITLKVLERSHTDLLAMHSARRKISRQSQQLENVVKKSSEALPQRNQAQNNVPLPNEEIAKLKKSEYSSRFNEYSQCSEVLSAKSDVNMPSMSSAKSAESQQSRRQSQLMAEVKRIDLQLQNTEMRLAEANNKAAEYEAKWQQASTELNKSYQKQLEQANGYTNLLRQKESMLYSKTLQIKENYQKTLTSVQSQLNSTRLQINRLQADLSVRSFERDKLQSEMTSLKQRTNLELQKWRKDYESVQLRNSIADRPLKEVRRCSQCADISSIMDSLPVNDSLPAEVGQKYVILQALLEKAQREVKKSTTQVASYELKLMALQREFEVLNRLFNDSQAEANQLKQLLGQDATIRIALAEYRNQRGDQRVYVEDE